MKTLGIIAVIWILYSMYRVFIKKNVETTPHFEFGGDDLIVISAYIGSFGFIGGLIYLIITYLP